MDLMNSIAVSMDPEAGAKVDVEKRHPSEGDAAPDKPIVEEDETSPTDVKEKCSSFAIESKVKEV
jgi:hypothetical protein